MGWKIDRHLIVVEFVSWLPGEIRLRSKQPIDANQKQTYGCKLWAPWPVDDRTDEYLPEKMKPEEQGTQWAADEVFRRKPEGMEVLAVIGYKLTGILESSILNQPAEAIETPAGASGILDP